MRETSYERAPHALPDVDFYPAWQNRLDGSLAVGTRCYTHDGPEHLAEITLAAEADELADFRNRDLVIQQQVLGSGNSETGQIGTEGLAHSHFEELHEMRTTHRANPCGVLHLDGSSKVRLEKIKNWLQAFRPALLVNNLAGSQMTRIVLEQQEQNRIQIGSYRHTFE